MNGEKTALKDLKLKSRQALQGRYGTAVGAYIAIRGILLAGMIAIEIILVIGSIFFTVASDTLYSIYVMLLVPMIYLFVYVLSMILAPGHIKLYLNICKGEAGRIGDIFFGIKNHFGKFLLIILLILVMWLVLMIPNVVWSLALFYGEVNWFYVIFQMIYNLILLIGLIYVNMTYGLFYAILTENPKKGILEAIKESKALMKGNRWRAFLLSLSFFGWFLFVVVTFGVGILWLVPYISCTYVQFYLDLKPKTEVLESKWQESEGRWELGWEQAETWNPKEDF